MTGRAVVVAVLIAMIIPGVAGAQTIEEQQWHLAALGVPDAHAITRGDGVVVAVVDSGVDGTAPDLAGALLPGTGFGTASGTDGTRDNDGHGTAMATLIAGRGVDGGALGVAPGARILPVSVGADGAKFSTAAVSEGVTWAVDQGADVVNLSLTSLATLTPDLLRAINYALDHDVVVIAGTGNEGEEHIGAPANIKGVIAVSGTVNGNGPWPESNTGPEAVLAAPAQGIVTAMPLTVQSTGYAGIDGTSAATALVSGAAALVRARYPDLDAGNVVNRLIVTATDLMAPGRDSQTGFGLVNPVAALTADVPPVERNPLAPPPRTSSATPPPASVESLPAPPFESGDQTPILMAAGGVAAVVLVVALLLVRRNRVRRTPVPVVTEIPSPSDDFWRGDRP
ncbi:type VII secretion-associated serine protease mycosin [Saccharothrix ecbatanensis]|uniref:Type VII secretion-associated serine protease mycosin n=1 Tax=Saccharothrix ecbatanensis TaxID=1105145 RepID=A0A7W9HQR8_9PSEU|nr:S8 family serine peptidase [Saccharothrix ecbatanensis]MBB5806704.1 type VII secretion-associated serine protease mycosin [Saccharothrix ecbatanensis]